MLEDSTPVAPSKPSTKPLLLISLVLIFSVLSSVVTFYAAANYYQREYLAKVSTSELSSGNTSEPETIIPQVDQSSTQDAKIPSFIVSTKGDERIISNIKDGYSLNHRSDWFMYETGSTMYISPNRKPAEYQNSSLGPLIKVKTEVSLDNPGNYYSEDVDTYTDEEILNYEEGRDLGTVTSNQIVKVGPYKARRLAYDLYSYDDSSVKLGSDVEYRILFDRKIIEITLQNDTKFEEFDTKEFEEFVQSLKMVKD